MLHKNMVHFIKQIFQFRKWLFFLLEKIWKVETMENVT